MSEAALVGALERFALALGGGLGLIVAAERNRLAGLGKSTLFLRWRTWAISAPLFALAVAGPAIVSTFFVLALSFQATRELARMSQLPPAYRVVLFGGCIASSVVVSASTAVWLTLPTIVFLAASLVAVLSQHAATGLQRAAHTLLGFVWVPWMLGFFLLVKALPLGIPLLLATGMAVALSDVCAFTMGKLFGKHALAPRLSPAKTWEGVAGNVAGAYLGFGLMWSALSADPWTPVLWFVPLAIAVGCLWGDLFESLVKRSCGVKDTGTWLPGFGGLLDRIDSLLFALPLVYATATVVA